MLAVGRSMLARQDRGGYSTACVDLWTDVGNCLWEDRVGILRHASFCDSFDQSLPPRPAGPVFKAGPVAVRARGSAVRENFGQ
jgi:hypothetical protein